MQGSSFGLRARLLLLVLAAVLPAFGLIGYTALAQRQQAALNAEEKALHLVRTAAREQGQLIASTRQLLLNLSRLPAVRNPGTAASCSRVLAEQIKLYRYYTNFGVATPNGRVFCSALPLTRPIDIADRSYFQRAMQSRDFGVGDYQVGRITKIPAVNFGYPIVNSGGSIQAVVYAALNLSWLNELVPGVHLPAGSTLTVVDSRGTILARDPEPEKWVGKSISDLPRFRAMFNHKNEGIAELDGIDGVRRLYAFAPLHDSPSGNVYVSVGIPKAVAFAAANQVFTRSMMLLLLVAVLALAAAWVGSNVFVLRRLQALADATRRLGQGDLSARTGLPHGREELGQLARSFDEMAHSLEQNDIQLHATEAARRQSDMRFVNIVSTAIDAIISVDQEQRVTMFNRGAEAIFGYAASEILDQPLNVLLPERFRQTHFRHMNNFAAATETSRLMGQRRELWGLRKDGTEFPAEASISKLSENGKVIFTTILRDITARRQAEETISRLAYYDPLTGFPNRTSFRGRVQQEIAAGLESHQPVALLLMDLNRFKEVNETLGHIHGDTLLREVGQRLRAELFERDVIARLGGDEFGILLPRLTASKDAGVIINKLLRILEAPFIIEGIPIAVEAGIGVALAPDHATDADGLLQKADVAMYQAKRSGSGHVIYAPEYDPYTPQRLALMAELRDAIEQDQLMLHYQPIIDLKTGRPVASEALVRWRHPQKGLIPPDQFIGAAEQTGLIKPLTQWVLNAALCQIQACHREGLSLRVGVNLSARSLHDPLLPDLIATSLKAAGATPEQLVLEITESAVILDPTRALNNLSALHRMGVLLSIDDFGTGYTSLGHLKELPVDEIKIDKSFVLGILTNENDAMIVRSIIELSHNLGFKVVAEGVEDKNTLDRLAEMKCDYAQGYHICRPVPVEDFKRWYDALSK